MACNHSQYPLATPSIRVVAGGAEVKAAQNVTLRWSGLVGYSTRVYCSYARFTLADPMQSEANRDKTIRRHVGTQFTLAEWRAMRTFASVGMVKESYLLQLTSSGRQLHCTCSVPDRPTPSR